MTTAPLPDVHEAEVTRRRSVPRRRLADWSRGGVVAGWLLLAAAVIFVSQLSNTMWAFANPAPHHWDNAEYLNFAYADLWANRFGGPDNHLTGWRGVYDSVMHADHDRPPGYRIVSLPFVFLRTRMLPTLRAVSLIVFWATLGVMYRTAVVVLPGGAGRAAGAAAAMLAAIYLEVGWSVRVYGTEYTLYFAVAAVLWCFARGLRPGRPPGWTWAWLGLSLGLGILSKLSFLFLAAPVGLVVLAMSITGRLPGLPPGRLCGAAAIGLALAFPWYRYHLYTAYRYGQDMTQFGRHSLHRHGLHLIGAWLALHTTEGLGPRAAAILAGLAGVALLAGGVRWWRRPAALSPAGWLVVVAVAQGVPLLAFQLAFSDSDNVRHMTPAYLPLTVAAAVAAGSAGVLAAAWSWPLLLAAAVPAVQQVGRDFVPLTTTADDVWDWAPLFEICRVHGLRYPLLGRVGNAAQFCDPAIVAPWKSRGDWAACRWLWRPEDGPFDWAKVEPLLADRQVVVTAPQFNVPADDHVLAEPLQQDNANNDQFADRMAHEPGWLPPERFDIGVVHKATVWVFLRAAGRKE